MELKEKEENTIIKKNNDELINTENINLEADNIELNNVDKIEENKTETEQEQEKENENGNENATENKIFTPLPNDYNKKNNSFGVLSLFHFYFLFLLLFY